MFSFSFSLLEKSEESKGMSLARSLLSSPSSAIVRQGDVLSQMIEYGARSQNWGNTKALVVELQKRLGPVESLTYYVSQGIYTIQGVTKYRLVNSRTQV